MPNHNEYTSDQIREMLRGAPGTLQTACACIATEMQAITYRLNRPSSTGLKGENRHRTEGALIELCDALVALADMQLPGAGALWTNTAVRIAREGGVEPNPGKPQ